MKCGMLHTTGLGPGRAVTWTAGADPRVATFTASERRANRTSRQSEIGSHTNRKRRRRRRWTQRQRRYWRWSRPAPFRVCVSVCQRVCVRLYTC